MSTYQLVGGNLSGAVSPVELSNGVLLMDYPGRDTGVGPEDARAASLVTAKRVVKLDGAPAPNPQPLYDPLYVKRVSGRDQFFANEGGGTLTPVSVGSGGLATWAPNTAYVAGDTRIIQGMVGARRANGTSGSTSDGANWLFGTEPDNVPVVKPSGDGRAGVFEMVHNDTTGYLFHLLAGTSMGHGQALIALGVDNDGIGLLIPNKKKGRALVIDQQSGITDAAAYGIHATQGSNTAPLARFEMNVNDAADVMQLLAFGTPGASQKLLYVGDPDGEAGRIDALTGKLQWRRPIHMRDSAIGGANPSYLRALTSTAVTAANEKHTLVGNDGVTMFGTIGSATQYAPFRVRGASSAFSIGVAPFLTPADHTAPQPSEVATWSTVFTARYSSGAPQLSFFGATAVAQPTGTPAASTDLASVITLANSLRTALVNLGLVA